MSQSASCICNAKMSLQFASLYHLMPTADSDEESSFMLKLDEMLNRLKLHWTEFFGKAYDECFCKIVTLTDLCNI
jgi:hypothetical protein